MTISTIDAGQAHAMIRDGAILVDIRDADEHARERIAEALHIPLSRLCDNKLQSGGKPVIYHCKSGNRTRMNAELLLKAGGNDVHVLAGGIEGWKAQGFAVHINTSRPIEMMRQVQIAAGCMTLLGAVLGFMIHPAFFGLSAFVGAGLMFSGISGKCAMASLLKHMPWNRKPA